MTAGREFFVTPFRPTAPMKRLLGLFLVLAFTLRAADPAPKAERAEFGRTPDGAVVEVVTLTNSKGSTAKIITFGAIVADLRMPDREGKLAGMVKEMLPTPENFQRGFPQAAAIMGRVTNRISTAKFTLDGKEYPLAANLRPHHIHGGVKGFGVANWRFEKIETSPQASVTLVHVSPDGDEGYPGKLTVSLRYTLTNDNTFRLDYTATTDAPTIFNPTNHAYFNLAGGGDVLEHELTINAQTWTVAGNDRLPTGEIAPIAGGPLDFTKPAKLGARAAVLGGQRPIFDHNFVINRPSPSDTTLALAARCTEATSGRALEVWTTEPGVQLYTSVLNGQLPAGRAGFFCLETQHHPDSIHQEKFPSIVVRPGTPFRSTTEWRFSAK